MKHSETVNPTDGFNFEVAKTNCFVRLPGIVFAPQDRRLLRAQTKRAAGKAETVAILTLKK